MRIEAHVIDVLKGAEAIGPNVTLPGQLDPRTYKAVDRVLQAAGGRWNKKARAHVFDGDAGDALADMVVTGEVLDARRDLGAFLSPPEVVARVIALADLRPGMRVLEPSAGRGALAAPAHLAGCSVDCVETDPRSVAILTSTPYAGVVEGDFLAQRPNPAHLYDRVIANPPFLRGAEARHVLHALRFLKPTGRLVTVMSTAMEWRNGGPYKLLRQELGDWSWSTERLPSQAFASSGATVETLVLTASRQ